MATVQPSNQIVFSPESFDFRDEVRDRLWERMRALAIERVRSAGRQRVTEEDFKATLAPAIREVMADFGVSVTVG